MLIFSDTYIIRETHFILNPCFPGMKYTQVIESYQIRQRAHLLLQFYLRVSHACLSPSMLPEPSCDRSWTQLSPNWTRYPPVWQAIFRLLIKHIGFRSNFTWTQFKS